MFYFPQIPFLISLRRNHLTIELDTMNRVKSKVSGFASSIPFSFIIASTTLRRFYVLEVSHMTSSSKCLRGVRGEKDQHQVLFERCEGNVGRK